MTSSRLSAYAAQQRKTKLKNLIMYIDHVLKGVEDNINIRIRITAHGNNETILRDIQRLRQRKNDLIDRKKLAVYSISLIPV